MCEYNQIEYKCGHCHYVAAEWCRSFIETSRRCVPDVQYFQYRGNQVCGNCRPQEPVEWESMINRKPMKPWAMVNVTTNTTTPKTTTTSS